eukprot:scaffold365_cov361-Pavlova_lutheri.AAC.5
MTSSIRSVVNSATCWAKILVPREWGNKVASFQDLPCIAGFAVRCEDSRSTPVHVYHLRLAEDDGGCSS